jgi:3-deoxy-D-manno-octulosonic acid (KDO) 8-phosphate synthase
MEVHEEPARALSDGPNAYRLGRLEKLLRRLLRIREAARS